jgi:DNA-binding response OmpR family regulator
VALTVSKESDSPRIYVVDDEWIIAETLAAILTNNGFRAHAFHNPNRALVRAMDQPPDILLTDVMMPDLTGIDLAVALRRAGLGCRILLFSGQSVALDLLCDARRRGYDFELLDKPLHPMQLLLRLRNTTSRVAPIVAPSRPDPIEELAEEPVAEPTSGTIPAA